MAENEKTLADLAAEWGKTLGVKIEWYQSPDPETDAKVRSRLNVEAKEIQLRELVTRKTSAVLFFVEFAEDVDSSGMVTPRLFEFSESASAEYRAMFKAGSSFGDLFRGGLIQ
jgi:hypothetical protein